MIIDNIKINGFGKIKNKDIEFKDGINIVYGENETGKSTIFKCIASMLYDISKNKNGKNISDFDQYKPWSGSEFSGKISYTLDDGNSYEVFREFKKKNPIIYNRFGEDISNEFNRDKSKEINFLDQQIGVDESSFLNTAIIQQQSVKLDKIEANNMVQKISNLVSTGSDNMSFKKSMDKLNKLQNETVGTDRTKQKPINIVEDNIKELLEDKKRLIIDKESVNNHIESRKKLKDSLSEEQIKKEFLKEVKQFFEETKIRNVEIDFEHKLEKDYADKVDEIKQKINLENISAENKKGKVKGNIYTYILLFFIIFAVIMFVFVRNMIVDLISIIPIGIMTAIIRKNKNIELDKLHKSNQELAKEYEMAVNYYNQKKKEVKDKEKNVEIEKNKNKRLIMDKYKKKLGSMYVENILDRNSNEIENEIDLIENTMNDLTLQSRMLENEKENIDSKLEELTRIEEKIEEQKNIREELISLNTSFNIAKECLENAYEEIKHNISPKFEQNLCSIIADITDGKYKNIAVNDEVGLRVEIENGEYVPVDRLSIGTIDEMYLSLRLSTLSEITEENLPIILDESFAYFDNQRLKNIMRYLQDKNYNNQIIIFTCSNREENALNELKIEYNLINLEK